MSYDDAFWDDVLDRDQTMFWVNEGTCICISLPVEYCGAV